MGGRAQLHFEAAADLPDRCIVLGQHQRKGSIRATCAYALYETTRLLFSEASPSHLRKRWWAWAIRRCFAPFAKGSRPLHVCMKALLICIGYRSGWISHPIFAGCAQKITKRQTITPEHTQNNKHVRLKQEAFAKLWKAWNGVDMNFINNVSLIPTHSIHTRRFRGWRLCSLSMIHN